MSINPEELLEPCGWFRWLHDAFAGRYALRGGFRDEAPLVDHDWESSDVEFVARHAWEAGLHSRLPVLERFWDRLTPSQRGRTAAGLSENESAGDWISRRLTECELDALCTCELACNALRWGQDDLLSAVLDSSADLAGDVPRYDGPGRKSGRFSETVSLLSCRCVDLVLEAALIRRNDRAAGLALERGANPDAPIWVLERSYSEKHCALSYCLRNGMAAAAELLLAAGANPAGNDFCTPNLPLYLAVSDGNTDFALKLLDRGAAFASADPGGQRKNRIRKVRKENPRLISPAADYFFGHFDEDLKWVRSSIGSLIPLVPVEEKQCFYSGNGQGGYWRTFLNAVGGDVTNLRRYEALGLDSRLSAEEFLSLVQGGFYDKLLYLLSAVPEATKARVLFRVRRRDPSFGEGGPMALLPQADRVSDAEGFDPGTQKPLVLPDGSALYVDFDAIAGPGHPHGPCLEGHIWHLAEKPAMRRRGERTIMKRLGARWEMAKRPENIYQIRALLPVIRRIGRRDIRLGCTLGNLTYHVRDENLAELIREWEESPDFTKITEEASGRIEAQDRWNRRPPEPALSEVELDGYPKEFWPFLDRVDSGVIGMPPEKASAAMLHEYRTWERRNKKEDSFVPDPRILDCDIWQRVPPELRPFLIWDDLFERPGFRAPDGSEYEAAMSRKATKWWNGWIIPQVLDALESGEK
jgi:hypothetical protein